MAYKQKIIIDTDIGDDIDDAFAIQYALMHPDIDLLGVTTVYKNALQRALMTKNLLNKNGRGDIKVYVGNDNPISEPLKPFIYEKNVNGKTQLLSFENSIAQSHIETQSAVDFIVETADKNPAEITLICIGPLTNIARAILKAPESMRNFKQLLIMGGNYKGHLEWNIMCDPEAADIVFNSGLNVKCVGSDLTEQCIFSKNDLITYLSYDNEAYKYINSMMKDWIIYNMRPPIMHDALAVSMLVTDFISFLPSKVEVPLIGGKRGSIKVTEMENSNLLYAKSFDKNAFMEHFHSIMAVLSCAKNKDVG